MHISQMDKWMHAHRFDGGDRRAEKKTTWVVLLTACTMVAHVRRVVEGLIGKRRALYDCEEDIHRMP